MKIIQCAGSKIAICDDKWYPVLIRYKWWMSKGYPMANISGRVTAMHHVVLPPSPGLVTHHINGLRHDAREENLKNVTPEENRRCMTAHYKNDSTGCRHIYRKDNGKFEARVTVDRRAVHIGMFRTLEEAKNAVEEYKRTGMTFRQRLEFKDIDSVLN